ncbi:Integrin beta-like protein [Quillaja saponaria]|uniref:Integrin beta-like protein n=1 Tax=Quillaja saponaria TaxID=32244 RepID=A0AAD7PXG0_QUISA|nr:Integrin beta-like protein [Quillaja saponaria]
MTVRTLKESQERYSVSASDLQKPKEVPSPDYSMDSDQRAGFISQEKHLEGNNDRDFLWMERNSKSKVCMEEETDQESGGSSEETESPKSVTKVRGPWKNKVAFVHSQILRIREEDSHFGEEFGDKVATFASPLEVVLFSRPTSLPSSPLSGKTITPTPINSAFYRGTGQ